MLHPVCEEHLMVAVMIASSIGVIKARNDRVPLPVRKVEQAKMVAGRSRKVILQKHSRTNKKASRLRRKKKVVPTDCPPDTQTLKPQVPYTSQFRFSY